MAVQTFVAGQPMFASNGRDCRLRSSAALNGSRSGGARTRIPDSLWKLVANLASTDGVSRSASRLMLDDYALKRRVMDRPRGTSDKNASTPEIAVHIARAGFTGLARF